MPFRSGSYYGRRVGFQIAPTVIEKAFKGYFVSATTMVSLTDFGIRLVRNPTFSG